MDCSQIQNAIAGQYGSAIADGKDSTAEVAQELNISQNQVNACLGTVGVEEKTEKTEEKSEQERSGGETTLVRRGETIIVPKGVQSVGELPETGGPGGIALAAGCALLGVGLIINRMFR